MSQEPKKEMTFQEYYTNMRGNVIVTYDNAKELALKALDDLAGKYAKSQQQIEALQGALKASTKDKQDKPKEKTPEKKH